MRNSAVSKREDASEKMERKEETLFFLILDDKYK
jgi:hypothetical protein